MNIRVRAVFSEGGPAQFGFDGMSRRRNGDEFDIDESKFDASWMQVVEVDAAADEESTGDDAPKPKATHRKGTTKAKPKS